MGRGICFLLSLYLRFLRILCDEGQRMLQSIFFLIASICSRSYVALIFFGDYTRMTGTIACTS
jgi:hypothetical protein